MKLCKVGDRIIGFGKKQGIVTKVQKKGLYPYQIRWEDDGHKQNYSAAEFSKWEFQVLPPDPTSEDIEEEETAQLDLDFSKKQEQGEGEDKFPCSAFVFIANSREDLLNNERSTTALDKGNSLFYQQIAQDAGIEDSKQLDLFGEENLFLFP